MEKYPQPLLDLAAVHDFYVLLLQENLGFEIPVPREIQLTFLEHKDQPSTDLVERWLALLDLAIAPVMVRDGLKDSAQMQSAEAMLRYFCRKRSAHDPDRDKADFVITFLFRLSELPLRSSEQWDSDAPSAFEQRIGVVLGIAEVQPLPEQHRQLVREFPFVRQEVEDIGQFDKLMDSGVLQRVRDIKQRLGTSFYHPHVLATIAEYNVFMGDHFDELFREAARSIKQFATSVHAAGGSLMARVEGDVTVQQLANMQEEEILGVEYGRAQEHLRNVSRFKKAVDRRTGSRAVPASAAIGAKDTTPPLPSPAPTPAQGASVRRGGGADEMGEAFDPMGEEAKIRAMTTSIRSFVLAADARSANVFPMGDTNLPLSPIEVDAFRSEFLEEKSFRRDFTQAVRQAVAIRARMMTELKEFRLRRGSAYLWKPHADSLAFLVQAGNRVRTECAVIVQLAQARGLTDKVNGMNASLQRLQEQTMMVAEALQGISGLK